MSTQTDSELRGKLRNTYLDYGMKLLVSGGELDEILDEAMQLIEADRRKSDARLRSDIALLAGIIEGLRGKPEPYVVKNYPEFSRPNTNEGGEK